MGTLILSLLFSAFIVWVIVETYIPPEEAKPLGYTHHGVIMGVPVYLMAGYNEDGLQEIMFCGRNMLSDKIVVALYDVAQMFANEDRQVKIIQKEEL